jgi:inhibitor of KinA
MSEFPFQIKPLGESALIVEFGNEISVEINELAIALADRFVLEPIEGLIEAFPAYSSTAIYYDPVVVRKAYPEFGTAFRAVSSFVQERLSVSRQPTVLTEEVLEVPAHFSASAGPDLEDVALKCGLIVSDVIDIFLARTYRVFMVGFLPGFAYMGEVDERIRMPRRQQPRRSVPKGSVGIAGAQTGVYPLETPGGWQIIGRTDVEFFTPDSASPSLLKAGDLVRFIRR